MRDGYTTTKAEVFDDAPATDVAQAYLARHSRARTLVSVVPTWVRTLPLQQQSVLLLATRGPDGAGKDHRCKRLVRVYRGTLFKAARHGRLLSADRTDCEGDTFMDRRPLRDPDWWREVVREWVHSMEELPHHYVTHFVHGVEILGYKHPDPVERGCWHLAYLSAVDALHLSPESEVELDVRLADWGRLQWDGAESDEENYYGADEPCAAARRAETVGDRLLQTTMDQGTRLARIAELADGFDAPGARGGELLMSIYALATGHDEDWRR